MEKDRRNFFPRGTTITFVYAFHSLKQTFEARASEWVLSAALLSLGLICYFNVNLFASSPTFDGVARWADQRTWGLLLVTSSAMRLSVLLINGAWWRTPLFRSILAFVSCFVWYQLFVGTRGNYSFGLALFPWLFLLDAYNALRAGREAGISEYLHRNRKQELKARNGTTNPKS